MTLFELLKTGIKLLTEKDIEDADFDAKCLLEYVFELHPGDLLPGACHAQKGVLALLMDYLSESFLAI